MKFFVLFPIFLSIISGSLGQYCPESWKQFRTESCFKLIQQSVTKDNAVAVCAIQDSSSSLASIKSDPLQKFITKYVYEEQGSTQNVWTGGSRTSDGQSFIWADKEALEFENWDVGSPDIPDRLKRCIQLNYNSGKWSDVECGSANQVLCQLDLPWTAYSKQIKTLQDHIKTLEIELALKANETELEEVQTLVTDIKADYIKNEDIEAVEAQIALKADQRELDELGGIVQNLSANISALQSEVGVIDDTYVKEEELKSVEEDLTNALDLKADDEEVDKLTLELGVANVTLWGHSSELVQLNSSVSNLTENAKNVSEALSEIGVKLENIQSNTNGSFEELIERIDTGLEKKADQSSLTELDGTVASLSSTVTDIVSKVDTIESTYVNNDKLEEVTTNLNTSINLKAEKVAVDNLTNELAATNLIVQEHSTDIEQLHLSVTTLDGNVEIVSEALKVIDTKLENLELNTTGSLDELKAHIDSGLLTKADQSSFVELSGKVDTLESDLTALQTEIGDIDETFVKEDELRAVQEALIIEIDQKADDVSLRQVKIDVEAANEIIKDHTTELEQLGSKVSDLSLSVDASIVELKEYVDTGLDTKAEKLAFDIALRSLLSLGDDVEELTDDFKVVKSNYVDKDTLNIVESTLQNSIDLKADHTEVDYLSASMTEVQGKVQTLETTLNDLTGEVRPDLAELKLQVLDLQASDIGTNATIDTFRETVNDDLAGKADKSQVDAINGIVLEVQDDITKINGDLTTISQEYPLVDKALQEDVDNLRVLVDAKAEQTYLDGKVLELQGEDTQIKTRLDVVETTVSTLVAELDTAEGDIAELKDDVVDLKEEDKTINGRVDTLGTHVDISLALKADQTAVEVINKVLVEDVQPQLDDLEKRVVVLETPVP